jgi:hypothetical protein
MVVRKGCDAADKKAQNRNFLVAPTLTAVNPTDATAACT